MTSYSSIEIKMILLLRKLLFLSSVFSFSLSGLQAKTLTPIGENLPQTLKSTPTKEELWLQTNAPASELYLTKLHKDSYKELFVKCNSKEKSLEFDHSSIDFDFVGQNFLIKIEENPLGQRLCDPKIFFRSSDHIKISTDKHHITSIKEGKDELIFYYKENIYILPVNVALKEKHVPKEIKNITSYMSFNKKWVPGKSVFLKKENLHNMKQKNHSSYLYQEAIDTHYKKLSFQIVDDKSNFKKGNIFPISNAKLKIVGVGNQGTSDNMGIIKDVFVPYMSRILLHISDKNLIYKDSYYELEASNKKESDLIVIKLKRKSSLDNIFQSLGIEEEKDKSSLCVYTKTKKTNLKNSFITHDSPLNEAVYYLNLQGFLDENPNHFPDTKYFCLLNIEKGPINITINQENENNYIFPIHIFSSGYQEIEIDLDKKTSFTTTPVIMTNNIHQTLDFGHSFIELKNKVNLNSFGDEDSSQNSFGNIPFSNLVSINNWLHYYSYAPEIEPTVFSFSPSKEVHTSILSHHTTAIFPRGFIDNLALEAGVMRDLSLGTILVDHKKQHDQDSERSISIKVYDEKESELQQYFIYNEGSESKKVFFNVKPGLYVTTVEDDLGDIIDMQMSLVYSDFLSYINTGSSLRAEKSQRPYSQKLTDSYDNNPTMQYDDSLDRN